MTRPAAPDGLRATLDVLVLHAGQGDSVRYRCEHLVEQLARIGFSAALQDMGTRDGRALVSCRLCVVHRVALDRFVAAQLARLRAAGTPITFDVDDLVFEPAEAEWFSAAIGDSAVKRAIWRRDLAGMRASFAFADGVIAATGVLAERARAAGKTAWLHRNAYSGEMLRIADTAARRRPQNGRVVIGYASGTPTHQRDFATVREALSEVLHRHPESELHVVGHLDPGGGWGDATPRVIRRPVVPWRDLPETLASFDVNLAPIEVGRPFCDAKSEVKYIEAALVGVPTVASPTEAFLHAIRDGENGFLAATGDEWREALSRLVTDAGLRGRAGEHAAADVRNRFGPAVRSAELAATLERITRELAATALPRRTPAGASAGRPEPAPAPPPRRRWPDAYRAWYAWRYEDAGTFALRLAAALHARIRGTARGRR